MKITEQSFGAKLKRAQDVFLNAAAFAVYSPPRAEESLANLQTLLDQANNSNSQVAQRLEQYSLAVDVRYQAYNANTNSLKKLAAQILATIEAQFGKKSKEFRDTKAIVAKIRGVRLVPKPKPDAVVKTTEKTISSSHQSYGSLFQYFKDLTNTIQQFPSYTSNNSLLSVANLEQKIVEFNEANIAVTQNNQSLNSSRNERTTLYAELKERFSRARAYVKSEYGNTSKELAYFKNLRL